MKFECTRCTKCCYKIVAIFAADLKRIWKHLGGSPFDYVVFRGDAEGRIVVGKDYQGVLALKQTEDGHCIFLEDDQCSIYDIRPITCQMYPFDPEVHVSPLNPKSMDIKKRYDKSCPGLGLGRKYRAEKIMVQWIKDRMEHDDMAIGFPGTLNEFIARCVGARLENGTNSST